jgi:hypothetical protein
LGSRQRGNSRSALVTIQIRGEGAHPPREITSQNPSGLRGGDREFLESGDFHSLVLHAAVFTSGLRERCSIAEPEQVFRWVLPSLERKMASLR